MADPDFHASTLQELPVGIWIARAPAGDFVYANRAFTEIFGVEPGSDPEGGLSSPRYGIRDRSGQPYHRSELPFFRALSTRRVAIVDDIVIHRPGGTRVNVRAFAKPLLDAEGQVTVVIVTFIDITAEVHAEAERAVAQERLATAVDHAPIILFAVDREGTVTLSEGAGLAALGFKPGELVGVSVHDLYRNNPDVLANHARVLAGETFTTHTEVGDAYLDSWMAPIRDASGQITGVIGVSTDVTNRRRLEAKAVLADRVMAMGRLSASVVHEIDNPLTYMMISLARMDEESRRIVGVLEDPAETTARSEELLVTMSRLKELLTLAREGAEQIRVVTHDLRSFSRPDDERVQPVDVCRVARSLLTLVSRETEARARLVVELEPVPLVAANEARLLQVFLNLVRNATQAMQDGDPSKSEMRVSTHAIDRSVVFEIADTGPGVPDAIRDRVFEPFFTTKAIGEGTGLGLFVSRNIVRELGGDITLVDRPGGGTIFRVTLPVHPEADLDAAPAVVQDPHPMAATPRARILVVADDPRVGRMLCESLRAHHDVELATGGREALALLASDAAFDLVFCDVMMRDVPGSEVYAEVRRSHPGTETKIVFMSGGAFTDRARAFLASVANDRLAKPFDIVEEVRKRLCPANPSSLRIDRGPPAL